MTPVYYNGTDYYKKMLELQRRLRRSEEERMRLEERFSLLEHESRSRHETCINRLRMRYIEFLEEQQARDERNHKLLGALDRVDSSLALISAKTDRLGTMRRQYEAASLFKNWYVNRRATGSVAGDSGVASQNNDGHVTVSRNQNRLQTNKNTNPFASPVNPPPTTASVKALSSANYSPSNFPTDPLFDFRRSASVRQENAQIPAYASSFSSPVQKPQPNISADADSKYFLENRQENACRSFHRSPQKYRYDYPRFNYNALESSESPLRSQNNSPLGYSREPGPRRASFLRRDLPKKASSGYSGFFKDDIPTPRSPSRFSRPIEASNPDYGIDEDAYPVGDLVENELERYMNRIPRLYRDRPQTPEEYDQEQNTSGDLLNVTLSDDGADFSGEERTRDEKTSPAEFAPFTTSQKPEIGKIGRSKLPNVRRNTFATESGSSREAGLRATREGRGLAETLQEGLRHGNRDFGIASDVPLRQLPSITSLSDSTDTNDKSGSPNNEKIVALAKNGISLEVARVATESGTRPSVNNGNIARDRENSNREIDAITGETRRKGSDARSGGKGKRDNEAKDEVIVEKFSGDPGNLAAQEPRIFTGEEREAGTDFPEYAEDLESWNPGELEKRVQVSTMLKSESQLDSIQRSFEEEVNDERWALPESEINVSGTNDEADQLRASEIENFAAGADEKSAENVESPRDHRTDSGGEQSGVISEVRNQDEASSQRFQDESSHDPNKFVDPNAQYEGSTGADDAYANQENVTYSQENYAQDQMQYEYPVDEQYREGSNVETYRQQDYDPQNNAQYESGANESEQYQYRGDDAGQYQEYNVDKQNSGQGYAAPEPNEQYPADNGQYVTDDNAQYVTDDNAQYVTDNNAQYVTGDNAQYVTDNNAQYVTGDNAQYVTGDNAQYATDTNSQYVTDNNAQYVPDDNAQYVTDNNAQYVTNPNESYITDPNAQYVTDPNESYITDPNAQYLADPNQEYSTDIQQYPENESYAQDGNQQCATNEAYEQNASTGNEGHVIESDEGKGLETTMEPDNSRSYGQEYEPTVETDHGQGYDRGPDESATQKPETDVRDNPSGDKLLDGDYLDESISVADTNALKREEINKKKTKDVIKSLLDSDTESTIEKNVSNAESDFDFN